MTYQMYSDGCHLKEFNIAGVGGYSVIGDKTIFEFSEQINDTIFHAIHERYALKILLEKGLENNLHNEKVQVFSDDQGLMKMLSLYNREGYYDNGNLFVEICSLCNQYKDISFHYIPRSENKRADKLSRKTIYEKFFSQHQIIEGGFIHPKWISKNNYPKDSTIEFSNLRKVADNYLVIHFHPHEKEKAMVLEFYYASNKDGEILYDKKETININKAWERESVNHIAKHLNVLSETVKNIGLVVHDEYLLLDQLLRGRRVISKNTEKAFENLNIALECLDNVFVHREALIYEKIFDDSPYKMKPKKKYSL